MILHVLRKNSDWNMQVSRTSPLQPLVKLTSPLADANANVFRIFFAFFHRASRRQADAPAQTTGCAHKLYLVCASSALISEQPRVCLGAARGGCSCARRSSIPGQGAGLYCIKVASCSRMPRLCKRRQQACAVQLSVSLSVSLDILLISVWLDVWPTRLTRSGCCNPFGSAQRLERQNGDV